MAFGPNAHLPTGAYRAEFTLESYVGGRLRAGGCFVEIAVGGVPLVQAPMAREPGRQVVSVSFAVSPEDSALDLETRVHVNGWRDVRVTSIRLKRVL